MTLEVVVPVYNEERGLAPSIRTLHRFLSQNLAPGWRIAIADNGSTDSTPKVAQQLSDELEQVGYIHMPEKGRGRALRRVWLESPADVVAYTDVDLSTELEALPRLLAALEDGAQIAIGSRLHPTSRVRRSLKREALSRGYNLLIRALFRAPFSDAQCGLKALRREAARELVPQVQDQDWFFDTELLLLAARRGYPIREVPVTWKEDPDSRVKVWRTVAQDLRGLLRLRLGFWGLTAKEHHG
jgi:glycosyltransferase involved in cell wall biosynthesis